MSAVYGDEFYRERGPQVPFIYTMNAEIGGSARKAVEEHMKSSEKLKSRWKNASDNKLQSVVGFVQMYSEKSQISLKAGGLTFYPLHITLLNFSEKMRLLLISPGAPFPGYLSVAFHSNTSGTIESKSRRKGYQRVEALRSLHECIKMCLKPLTEKVNCGNACRTKSGTCIFLHPALTPYVADIPETEDLSGIKNGGQTKHCCYECRVMKEKLCLGSRFPKRNVEGTQKLVESAAQKSPTVKELEQYFDEESLLPLLPMLSNFSLAGIHPPIKVYRII